MFCPNCGTNLEEGTVFCSNCGTKIEAQSRVSLNKQDTGSGTEPQGYQSNTASNTGSAQNTGAASNGQASDAAGAGNTGSAGQKKGSLKDKLKFSGENIKGLAAILIAIVAVILVVKLLGGLFGGRADVLVTVYDSDSEKSTVYLNDKNIGTVDGYASVYTNTEKSVFYIVDSDDDAYIVKGKKLKDVMDDCDEIIVANHAKTALLINNDNELYRYDGSKLTEITDDEVSAAKISGDGKVYAYRSEGDTYVGKKPGKEEKVKDVTIFALSENGKYLYGYQSEVKDDDDDDDYYGYYDSDDQTLVCVNLKGDVEKIQKEVSSVVGLNSDGTEIMFIHDGKTYVSVKGKEPKKVSGKGVYSVLYKKGNVSYGNYCYPVKSFKKALVYVSGTISKLNGKYEAEEWVDDIDNAVGIDEKLTKIYYLDDGDLYYAKIKKNAKGKKIAKDVENAYAAWDGSCVYYMDDEGTLYYVKGSKKAKEVDDDLEDAYGYFIGKNFYLMDDGDLYWVKGTKKEKLDVEDFDYDTITEKVYAYDDDELYLLNGKKLKKIKGDFKEIGGVSVY